MIYFSDSVAQCNIPGRIHISWFQHSLHSLMPLHHIKSHYNLILYYASTYVERVGVSQHDNSYSFIFDRSGKTLLLAGPNVWQEFFFICNSDIIINQNNIFFKKLLWSHFWIDFNKFYLFVVFKLCTNKNHSYKHNEQINKQNIDNSECFGVKFVKIYPEMTSQ
jgi:hypothetical protein